MFKHLRNAIRNPLVVAYTALALALTGGSAAYAVATIGSEDIFDGSILSKDIKNSGVKGIDVGNDTLTGSDIDESTLTGGARGFTGDKPAQQGDPFTPLVTVGDMSLSVRCNLTLVPVFPDQVAVIEANVRVSSSTNATASSGGVWGDTDGPWTPTVGSVSIPAGGNWAAGIVLSASNDAEPVSNTELQLIYQNDHEIIAVTIHLASNNSTDRCQVSGVATPAQL